MNNKNKLLKKMNELRNRLAFVAAAGVIGMTGCTPQKQNDIELETKKVNEIIQEIDEKIIEKNDVKDAEQILNDVALLLPKIKKEASLKEKEPVNFYDTIRITDYNGNSIEDALRLSGYGYSFAFREELAKHYGIEKYRGTAEQNILLLNKLRNQTIENKAEVDETKTTEVSENKEVIDSNIVEEIADLGNKAIENIGSIIKEETNNTPVSETEEAIENKQQENNSEKPSRPSRPNHGGGNGSGHPEFDNDKPNTDESKPNPDNDNEPTKPDVDPDKDNNPSEPEPTPGEDNDETKPSPNPDEDKDHNHRFGEWKSLDDNLEKRVCSCGHYETRSHKKETNTTYVDNHNGTHNKMDVTTCVNCDYESTTKNSEQCAFEFESYNALEETLLCSSCEAMKTQKHKPVAGEPLENGDIPYTCANKGCDWTEVKTSEVECEHIYDTTVSYNVKGNGVHEKVEISVCEKCGDRKDNVISESCEYQVDSFTVSQENISCEKCGDTNTRNHKPVAGEPLENGDIPYSCANKGCGWTKVEAQTPIHTEHTYVVVDYNEDEEILECTFDGCGKQITRAHSPVAGETDEFGNTSYTCAHDGCDWEKISHVHQTRTRTEKVGTEDVCTRKVTYCTIDGCDEIISSVDNPDHKFRTSSEGEILNCRTCGYDPNKELEEEIEELDIPSIPKEEEPTEPSTEIEKTEIPEVDVLVEEEPEVEEQPETEEETKEEETMTSESEEEMKEPETKDELDGSEDSVEEEEEKDTTPLEEELEDSIEIEEIEEQPESEELDDDFEIIDIDESKDDSPKEEEKEETKEIDNDFEMIDIDQFIEFTLPNKEEKREEKGRSRKLVLDEE